jgi:hypothetical protein
MHAVDANQKHMLDAVVVIVGARALQHNRSECDAQRAYGNSEKEIVSHRDILPVLSEKNATRFA